jgi:hypothetical protein
MSVGARSPGVERSVAAVGERPVSGADAGRTAVYAAEVAAFDGTDLETVVGIEAVTAAAYRVVADPWWPGPRVEVRPARSDARSSSARDGAADRVVIRISAPQATIATVAHELAHALAGVDAGHGPRFRRAHLDVVAVITNPPGPGARGALHVDQLAAAYAAAGLTVERRSWPSPPAPGSPIAL